MDEDEIVEFVNYQKKEIRDRLIEYLKCWNAPDVEEAGIRRKTMKRQNVLAAKLFLHGFLMANLPIDSILKKLEVDSQSHST